MATQVKVYDGDLTQNEIDAYIEYLRNKYPDRNFLSVEFRVDGDCVDVRYRYESKPFHRIRRVTGYLVGDLDKFNDAKRSEVNDRVKHSLSR